MGFTHGSGAFFSLGGTDVSQYLTEVDPNFERALVELRHLGQQYVSRLVGQRMASFRNSGDFDPALDNAVYTAWNGNAAVAWVYGPQGNAAGNVKYSGNCWVPTYKPGPAGSGDAVKFSFDVASDGTITRGTF